MAGQAKSSASSGKAGAATHGPQPPAHRLGHHGLLRLLPQFTAVLRGELARNLGSQTALLTASVPRGSG
jgi:hypothetical protein